MFKDYMGSPVLEACDGLGADYCGSTLESIEADTDIGLLQEEEDEMAIRDQKYDEAGVLVLPESRIEPLKFASNEVQYIPPRHIGIDELKEMAFAISKSGLFGMKTPEQALALMLISQAEGRHPALAARDYDIIQGKVSKKSEAVLRDFLECGGKVEWHEMSEEAAEATFSHPNGGKLDIRWDMAMADRAGLSHKQNWKQYPRQMLRARCVSEGVRAVAPMATSGMYVPEEVQDFGNSYSKPIEETKYGANALPGKPAYGSKEPEPKKKVESKTSHEEAFAKAAQEIADKSKPRTLKDENVTEFKKNLTEACKRLPKHTRAKLIAKAFNNPNLNESQIESRTLEEISKANLKILSFLTKDEK